MVGVDIGGTFTDAVAIAGDGARAAAKVRSTPRDLALGLGEALGELAAQGVEPSAAELIVHGTTIATNALLEGRLARVALIGTRGFRDLVAIGTGARQDMYDLWAARPEPPVAARDRLEVRERIGPGGEIVERLTDDEVARVVAEVEARRPESVAIALLFSFANPSHEARLRDSVAAALPGIAVVASSDVVREFREYPRARTTVVAAGLHPIVSAYLPRAEGAARSAGFSGPMLVMLSNGGVASIERAAALPHQLVLSGPAGGVAGAVAVGARLGVPDLVSLDVGGTSADVCLVRGGIPPASSMQHLDGAPLSVTAIDITSAGAGGGAVARVEAGQTLRVGPQSAGAEPGPASYGLGGEEPTVTDAHLAAGELAASAPLAGRLYLDPALAEEALRRVGTPLGLGADQTAAAILALARADIARTIRRVSIERGRDPRGLSLVAFGGAGPLHGSVLLRELSLGQVIVPPRPGLASADGLLSADLRIDASQTVLRRLGADLADLLAWFRQAARELSRELAGDGIAVARQRFVAAVDCRYVGQGFELSVPLAGLNRSALRGLRAEFHRLHEATYGHAAPGEPVEAVTLRLAGIGVIARVVAARLPRGHRDGRPDRGARVSDRRVQLPGERRMSRVPVWRREMLRWGDHVAGPCVIEQIDATTLVLRGMSAGVQPFGDLIIREAAR